MRTILATLLILTLAIPATATTITWEPNDDEMTGEERACVFLLNPDGAQLCIRVDAPDRVWVIYQPVGTHPGVTAKILFKLSTMDVMIEDAKDRAGDDLWIIDGVTQEMERWFVEQFIDAAHVKVQLRSDYKRGPIATFNLNGFTVMYKRAMRHVGNVNVGS